MTASGNNEFSLHSSSATELPPTPRNPNYMPPPSSSSSSTDGGGTVPKIVTVQVVSGAGRGHGGGDESLIAGSGGGSGGGGGSDLNKRLIASNDDSSIDASAAESAAVPEFGTEPIVASQTSGGRRYPNRNPTHYYLLLLLCIAILPLIETLLWLLIPLDVGMSDTDRLIDRFANPWTALFWYTTYGLFTIILLWYANSYLACIWDFWSGVKYILVAWCGMITVYAIIFKTSGENASANAQIGLVTALSWSSVAHTAWRVYHQNPDSTLLRAKQIRTVWALVVGMVVFSSLWVALQFLSGMFTSNSIGTCVILSSAQSN